MNISDLEHFKTIPKKMEVIGGSDLMAAFVNAVASAKGDKVSFALTFTTTKVYAFPNLSKFI